MGKPRNQDIDTRANVHEEMASIFSQLRSRLAPELYRTLLEAMAHRDR